MHRRRPRRLQKKNSDWKRKWILANQQPSLQLRQKGHQNGSFHQLQKDRKDLLKVKQQETKDAKLDDFFLCVPVLEKIYFSNQISNSKTQNENNKNHG